VNIASLQDHYASSKDRMMDFRYGITDSKSFSIAMVKRD
jgi:hypothetical protein